MYPKPEGATADPGRAPGTRRVETNASLRSYTDDRDEASPGSYTDDGDERLDGQLHRRG
jgi:hypothetical protein